MLVTLLPSCCGIIETGWSWHELQGHCMNKDFCCRLLLASRWIFQTHHSTLFSFAQPCNQKSDLLLQNKDFWQTSTCSFPSAMLNHIKVSLNISFIVSKENLYSTLQFFKIMSIPQIIMWWNTGITVLMHLSPVSGADMVLNQVWGCFRFKPVMEQKNWSDPLQFPAVNRFSPRTSIQRFTGYHYNHNMKRMCVMVISERVSLLMRVCRSLDKARAGLSDLTSRLPKAFCQDNLLLVLYSADIRHMLGWQLSFLAIAKWVWYFESECKNRRYRH